MEDALIKEGIPIEAVTKAEIDIIFDSLTIPDNPSEACGKLPNAYASRIGYFDMDTFNISEESAINIYAMDNTENVMFNWACFDEESSSEKIGNIYAQQGDIVLATISVRSELTLPDNLTLLHTSEIFGGDYKQTMSFAWMRVETTGEQTFTIHQAEAARFYLNLIALKNAKGISYDGSHYIKDENTDSLKPNEKLPDEILIWGCSSTLWKSSAPYGNWECSNTNTTLICLDQTKTAPRQPRQANFIDAINDDGVRSFTPSAGGKTASVVDAVKIIY